MACVWKIEYEGMIRRAKAPRQRGSSEPDLSFSALENKIREIFKISPDTPITVTYTDEDDDVVTMAGDEDLEDAFHTQALNPLYMKVSVKETAADSGKNVSESQGPEAASKNEEESAFKAFMSGSMLKQILKGLSPDQVEETVRKFVKKLMSARNLEEILNSYEPLMKSTGAVAEAVITDVVENVQKFLRSNSTPKAQDGGAAHERAANVSSEVPEASNSTEDPAEPVVHMGVTCDGCGVSPIAGPRYKSTREYNFDLCEACYKTTGNSNDYVKMESSVCHPLMRAVRHAAGGYGTHPLKVRRGPSFHAPPSCSFNRDRSKFNLDCRFVKDVNVFDGTELAPGTRFTKIWRLRNTGALKWPLNTRLVHVGGDKLGCDYSEVLEMPEKGVAGDEEIDVSVDLIAPLKPGRYVSHFRLGLPFGLKFGQRVWASIQVVEKDVENNTHTQGGGLKNNGDEKAILLHGSHDNHLSETGMKGTDNESIGTEPVKIEVEPTSVDDETPVVNVFTPPMVEENMSDKGIDAGDEKSELGGFSLVEKPVENEPVDVVEEENVAAESDASLEGMKEESVKHEAMMRKLVTIGFTSSEVNLELLEKNKWDLRQTLDDLFVLGDWEPMLSQLEEMGFKDGKLNRELMFKHEGSVKRVVKELVKVYK